MHKFGGYSENRQEPAFYELLRIIQEKSQLDLSQYKETLLVRKMAVRLRICRCLTFEKYLRYIESNPEELNRMISSLTINVTTFFRNPESYRVIKEEVLPLIYQYRQNSPIKLARFWSIGCSSGEEPYSVAMLVKELSENALNNFQAMIYATDVDENILKTAHTGFFHRAKIANLPERFRQRYFAETMEKQYKIDTTIRKMIIFKKHDLIKDPPFRRIDLILLRNVMIYFTAPLQKKILIDLYGCLNPGGFLVLGKVESPPGELRDFFIPFNLKEKIYRKPLEESY